MEKKTRKILSIFFFLAVFSFMCYYLISNPVNSIYGLGGLVMGPILATILLSGIIFLFSLPMGAISFILVLIVLYFHVNSWLFPILLIAEVIVIAVYLFRSKIFFSEK